MWTGDRAGSFLLDLQHPWVQRQMLLHRLPSLSTSVCEELSLTPFLDGNSVSSADVSMEQNKNTCSLLGRGEGKKLTAKSPVFLNQPTRETLCFQLSVRASPRCHCPICTPVTLGACRGPGWGMSLQQLGGGRDMSFPGQGVPSAWLPAEGSSSSPTCSPELLCAPPALASLKQPNKTPQHLPK